MGAMTEMAPSPFGTGNVTEAEIEGAIEEVWGDENPRIIFNHKWQTQMGMPRSDPKEQDLWTASDGRMILTIQRGYLYNPFTKEHVKKSIPFGILPRRIQAVVNALVIRNPGLRDIPIGEDFTPFLRKQLGQAWGHGGAAGNIATAKEQFMRMLSSHYRYYAIGEKRGILYDPVKMIEACDFYYDREHGEQAPRMIRVTKPYLDSLYEKNGSAIPVDLNAILRISAPLDYDVYSWLTLRVYGLVRDGKAKSNAISNKSLRLQLGQSHVPQFKFNQDFRGAITRLRNNRVYPGMKIEETASGWVVYASRLAVQRNLFEGCAIPPATPVDDPSEDALPPTGEDYTELNLKTQTITKKIAGKTTVTSYSL
jgi:hypothetical protein